jgi:isochorismate pyruvate lyase
MFVTDISRWEEFGRAHGAAFAAAPPATSMIGISALVDPRMLIEIEAVAYRPASGSLPDDGPADAILPDAPPGA